MSRKLLIPLLLLWNCKKDVQIKKGINRIWRTCLLQYYFICPAVWGITAIGELLNNFAFYKNWWHFTFKYHDLDHLYWSTRAGEIFDVELTRTKLRKTLLAYCSVKVFSPHKLHIFFWMFAVRSSFFKSNKKIWRQFLMSTFILTAVHGITMCRAMRLDVAVAKACLFAARF